LSPLGYKLYAAEQQIKDFLEKESNGNVTVELIEFPK